MVILLCPPGIQGLSLETLNFLSLIDRKLNFFKFSFRREHDSETKDKAVFDPTCPNTGEGEEPVVMAAGVKAERCRSCADGTLSEGF